jgi:hypothetical protein
MSFSIDADSSIPAPDRPSEREGEAGEAIPDARSGDFSLDPSFDPEHVFDVIRDEENEERVSAAMRAFVARGDASAFARAVAVFVRSANAQGQPIERVLAVLNGLADEREGQPYPHDWQPSELRRLVLRGVLIAFFGKEAVTEEARSQNLRRDAARRAADVGGEDEASGNAAS